MRFRLTILLLVLNAIAIGLIYLVRLDSTRASFDEGARLVLPSGLTESATRIEIAGAALEADWVFSRDGDVWQVESPFEWRANPFAIERLSNQLTHLRWETRFPVSEVSGPSREALAQYGLYPPTATIRVIRGEEVWEIPIGEATQVGNRLYLLSPDGDEIYVVSRELFNILASDLNGFFDRRPIGIPAFEARSLTIEELGTGSPRVRLTRRMHGDEVRWQLESPVQARGDTDTIHRVLDRVNQLEVLSFVEDPPENAFGSGSLRITVDGNNRRQTLVLGRPVEGDPVPSRRYLRIEGVSTVVEVDEEPFKPLFLAQEALRQRRFLDISEETPSAIDIVLADRSTGLQRLEGGRWQVAYNGPDGIRRTLPADAEVVGRIINHLRRLEAERFVTEAPSSSSLSDTYGLDPAQRRIRIQQAGAAEPVELHLGNLDPADNLVYARQSGISTIYKVRPGILGAIPASPLHYRERVLKSLPPAAVLSTLRLVDAETDAVLFERSLTEAYPSWDAVEVAESLAETGLRDSLAVLHRQMRRFTVRDYIGDHFTDPLALDAETQVPWAYRLEAEVRLPGAPDNRTQLNVFHITQRLGGRTQFGGSSEANLTFTLTQPLIDALEVILQAHVPAGEPPENAPEPPPILPLEIDAPEAENGPEPEETLDEAPTDAAESSPPPEVLPEADRADPTTGAAVETTAEPAAADTEPSLDPSIDDAGEAQIVVPSEETPSPPEPTSGNTAGEASEDNLVEEEAQETSSDS